MQEAQSVSFPLIRCCVCIGKPDSQLKSYLIFVIFFTLTHFESWKFYTRKVRKFMTYLPITVIFLFFSRIFLHSAKNFTLTALPALLTNIRYDCRHGAISDTGLSYCPNSTLCNVRSQGNQNGKKQNNPRMYASLKL